MLHRKQRERITIDPLDHGCKGVLDQADMSEPIEIDEIPWAIT